eukprot:s176_g19.t1
MANPSTPTVPEVQYEALNGEQLALDLSRGRSVDEIVREGVHVTLILMHAAGELPFDRPDLLRLARGESHVRPIEQVRITPVDGGRVLVVEGEIAPSVPLESLTNNQMIDVNQGIRPDPRTAAFMVLPPNADQLIASSDDEQNAAPSAEQTASAGIPPNVLMPGRIDPEIGRNDFPVESLHLMNETLHMHRLSRKGPVNREVSAALTRMGLGKDLTKIWRRLDEYASTDSEERCSKIRMDACEMANRMHVAQTGLAEAVYRRERNDEWSPLLSLLIPGTRSGGLSGCRFEHPDEHSNGPMSSLRLRMHSQGICTVQNGPNECMLETGWYCMSRAERMFLET